MLYIFCRKLWALFITCLLLFNIFFIINMSRLSSTRHLSPCSKSSDSNINRKMQSDTKYYFKIWIFLKGLLDLWVSFPSHHHMEDKHSHCINQIYKLPVEEEWDVQLRRSCFPAGQTVDSVCGCFCVCVLFMRASARPCGGGGHAMIQWCCDFNSGDLRTGGLFSPVALWVTVQSSLGRAVKPVRLRNERRWESKTQSRTEPWWTDLSTAGSHTGEGRRRGGGRRNRENGNVCRWKKRRQEGEIT